MKLRVYGKEPNSVFGVFGDKENTATFALGWVLTRSSALLEALLNELRICGSLTQQLSVDLQRHIKNGGFTDIELRQPNGFHLIVEAKLGWIVPSEKQLERYLPRFEKLASHRNIFLTISAASQEFAMRRLGSVPGVEIRHLAWSDIRKLAVSTTRHTRSPEERVWLKELSKHLEGYVSIQDISDNRVYVVSLSKRPFRPNSKYSSIDVVEQDNCYFHPFGIAHWPEVPPNYVGFRYQGHLQSVHHIRSYQIVRDLASVDARWPSTDIDHFVYRLGPPMRPSKEMPVGDIYPSGRVWCAIDTLLSGEFPTISAARDETKRRLNSAAS